MSVDARIVGTNTKPAEVRKANDYPAGLFVYTREYRQSLNTFRTAPFINPVNGANMAVDAAIGGTPVGIHNGTDSILWTASALSGVWNFASTAQAHTGTKSIDATGTLNSNQALIQGGSTVDMTNYAAISGWIYITAWPNQGTKDVRLQTRLAGTLLGNTVDLSTYIDVNELNVWQKFIVPKADLGLNGSTIDELIITTIDGGAGDAPDYYLDDIQIEETGGGVVYSVKPTDGSLFEVHSISLFMADALTGNYPNNISYNKLLNLASLPNGVSFNASEKGEVVFSSSFRDFADVMELPTSHIQGGSDGTNTWIKITYDLRDSYLTLDPRTNDSMRVVLNDDLTGLLRFRMLAHGLDELIES